MTETRHLPATQSAPRDQRAPSLGVPRFVVTQGPSAGRALLLTSARATVGRHPTSDLVIDDPKVSATHLELVRRESGRVMIRDVGTTNGTWLGPHRVYAGEIGPGALVRLGDSAVRVEIDDRAEPARPSEAARFGGLLGATTEMRELFAALDRVAPTELSLLVQGDAGTGKEELARAVHAASPRRDGPLVVLDAANLPPTLAESLIFGHERDAAPDSAAEIEPPADPRAHVGALERARGGTLFIDEIGALSIELQGALARALEARAAERLGGSAAIPIDLRLIAATQRDLRAEIDAGRFREDLFQRVAQVRLFLPPLRARQADIPLLTQQILDAMGTDDQRLSITPEAQQSLAERRWPGNVRELRNVLGRAAALCQGGVITAADLAGEGFGFRGSTAERDPLDIAGTFAEAKGRAIERFEHAYLEALLRRCGGNLSKASRQADIARNHLRALLKKRGLYSFGES